MRNTLNLKNVEAIDMADSELFCSRQRTEDDTLNNTNGVLTSRSNECIDSKKHRRRLGGSKGTRPHSAKKRTVLANDFHGFRWIDSNQDEYQSLNISGKSLKRRTEVYHSVIKFPEDKLVLPDIALADPYLVSGQTGLTNRRGTRQKRRDALELSQAKEGHEFLEQGRWKGRAVEENTRKKIFINVILPNIT